MSADEARLVPLVAGILGARLAGTPDWIMRPGRAEARECWTRLQAIYAELTGRELPEVMPPRERRKLDAVLDVHGKRRIFEFDGAQHFNADRATTLRACLDVPLAFPRDEWLAQSEATGRIKTGGWARPCPPLFPEPGGRHQQRAFRDAIADLLPSEYGYEPTLRIGYFEIQWLGTPREEEACRRLLTSRIS